MIVTPIEADDQTAYGLFLPETAKEKPQQGKVKEYLILKESDILAIVENSRHWPARATRQQHLGQHLGSELRLNHMVLAGEMNN